MIVCSCCKRDLDSIYQDNVSDTPNRPLCEDCAGLHLFSTFEDGEYQLQEINSKRYLSKKQFKFLMKHAGWSYIKVKNSSYESATKKINQIMFMIAKNRQTKEDVL